MKNLIRKSLDFNIEHYRDLGAHEFMNNGTMLVDHISACSRHQTCEPSTDEASPAHCLDTVRQVLMCNVDTAVLGMRWDDDGELFGFPDFKTTHKCKNLDDVLDWAEKLQV